MQVKKQYLRMIECYLKKLVIITLLFSWSSAITGQAKKNKSFFKDSLDGKFDLSSFLIDANGFVPVPYIITEPALGGIGGALVAVFLKKKPPLPDAKGKNVFTPPDITAAMAGYTANGSWFTGAARIGTIIKKKIKYRIIGGYADMNISLYRTLAAEGEKEYKFNFKIIPVILSVAKQLRNPRWSLGMQYAFVNTKTGMADKSDLPLFVSEKEINSNISSLGFFAEYDNRDNNFSPDRGIKMHSQYGFNAQWIGSDYEYGRFDNYMHWYLPVNDRWISGLRLDAQNVISDPPFYALPYISMRGIPVARYQGRNVVVTETEQRIDFGLRWSGVAFAGIGKAFNQDDFNEKNWVGSGGAGFRYLISRQFKLRMGIDIAAGPDTFAYYIVFGNYWLK
jgi:hypothetical protein